MTSASAPAVSVRGVSVRYPGKRPGEFADALEDGSLDRRRAVAEVEADPGHPWYGELQTPS
jgi:hypothetical protein